VTWIRVMDDIILYREGSLA
jgi:hypothetical protein